MTEENENTNDQEGERIEGGHSVSDLGEAAEAEGVDASNAVGKVVDGSVTNVTSFGAFVRLSFGEEGLVHISEIANEFVSDINQFVKVGDKVSVRVLARNDKGKLELSIRKAAEQEPKPALFIKRKTKDNDFESKISTFLKRSEEKQIDIRRNLKNKQGVARKRK